MNWKNKTVIITGSSIGIGRKVAKQLAEKGANIVLNARNEQRLQSTLNDFKSMGFEKAIAIAAVGALLIAFAATSAYYGFSYVHN